VLPIGPLYVRDLAALRESQRQIPREPTNASQRDLSKGAPSTNRPEIAPPG
jgi:hypothetical protein